MYPELVEAASLDGASRCKILQITWPLISPVTFYLIIVNIIAACKHSLPRTCYPVV
jgi:ABC-type sugar transport system permease subunit